MQIKDLLRLEGIEFESSNSSSRITLCRHKAHKNADLNQAMQRDPILLNAYQSEQGSDVFRKSGLILTFLPDRGQRALFVGAYENCGAISRDEYLKIFPGNPVGIYPGYEDVGASSNKFYYRLNPSPILEGLQRRLVINWGLSQRSWYQFILDKDVFEIYPKGYVSPFIDYYDVVLYFHELKKIMEYPDENRL